MNVKQLMTAAAEATLRGDPDAVEMADEALLALSAERINLGGRRRSSYPAAAIDGSASALPESNVE